MLEWHHLETLPSQSYACGHCGQPLASEKGWYATDQVTCKKAFIYICHLCKKPTFIHIDRDQTPGSIFGNEVSDIDNKDVAAIYKEARNCMSKNAFTAAVLCCRKLLMHIAVAKGAEENKNFIEYVEYLSDKNFITPDSKGWVDLIRSKGNEANHQIVIMEKEDAEDLIRFLEMLLKLIYEFPAKTKKKGGEVVVG